MNGYIVTPRVRAGIEFSGNMKQRLCPVNFYVKVNRLTPQWRKDLLGPDWNTKPEQIACDHDALTMDTLRVLFGKAQELNEELPIHSTLDDDQFFVDFAGEYGARGEIWIYGFSASQAENIVALVHFLDAYIGMFGDLGICEDLQNLFSYEWASTPEGTKENFVVFESVEAQDLFADPE
jgi:hypothetical protein